MRGRTLVALAVALVATLGCSATQLKAQKDGAWSFVPRALPDAHEPTPGGYGHPLRGLAFAAHPLGVALDYVLVRPFYMLAGLAPEWFGLTAEDAHRFQAHYPELLTPQNAPRRFD